jgi:Arc/MetJ-type ribon-helix-helix transcriptional regulator
MPVITVYLTEELYRKLSEVIRSEDVSPDEFIVKLLIKEFNIDIDPTDMVEFHLRLSEKFLAEAEEFLRRGDYVQASEKGWGATAQIVKALAAKEDRELRSHKDLWTYIDELAEKLNNRELRRLWRTVNSLHQTFTKVGCRLEMLFTL